MVKQNIRRGEIYCVHLGDSGIGHEQSGDFLAVVLSNNTGNRYSNIVEVAALSVDREQKVVPEHAQVMFHGHTATVYCEQIITVAKERLGQPVGMLSPDDMHAVGDSLAIALSLRTVHHEETGSFLRGQIYFVSGKQGVGSEQSGDRCGIIVSNNKSNRCSPVVSMVYLTSKKKNDLPTHVPIYSALKLSTALCEQVSTLDKQRINPNGMRKATPKEMQAVDRALAISLGLTHARARRS